MSDKDEIRFKCRHCGAALRAPPQQAGSPIRCTTCKRPTQVPERSTADPGLATAAAPHRGQRWPLVATGAIMLLVGCAIGFGLGRGFGGKTQSTETAAGVAPGPSTAAAPSNIKSHFELVNATAISGWVWNSDRPDAPVTVDIYDGDRLLASVPADEFRQDLVDAKMGNGRHGFSCPTPAAIKDGKPHTIRVLISETKAELGGSPLTFAGSGQ
jgi:hypothetical protein